VYNLASDVKVFENRVLRRISGPKRDEVIRHNLSNMRVWRVPRVFRYNRKMCFPLPVFIGSNK
jgi:hypothetical protein